MTILQRIQAPKPVFFRRVRGLGLALCFLCLLLLVLPFSLPAAVQTTLGCGYAAGLTAAAVSQLTTGGKTNKSKSNGRFIKRS